MLGVIHLAADVANGLGVGGAAKHHRCAEPAHLGARHHGLQMMRLIVALQFHSGGHC